MRPRPARVVRAAEAMSLVLAVLALGCGRADPDAPPPVQPLPPPAPIAAPPPPTPAAPVAQPTSPEPSGAPAATAETLERARVRFGRIDVRGGTSASTVRRVVRRHEGEIEGCYRRGLEVDGRVVGRLEARFDVEPGGAVRAVEVPPGPLGRVVEGCVAEAIQRWTFPGSGATDHVILPLVFSTR